MPDLRSVALALVALAVLVVAVYGLLRFTFEHLDVRNSESFAPELDRIRRQQARAAGELGRDAVVIPLHDRARKAAAGSSS